MQLQSAWPSSSYRVYECVLSLTVSPELGSSRLVKGKKKGKKKKKREKKHGRESNHQLCDKHSDAQQTLL